MNFKPRHVAENGQTGEMINRCCKNLRAEVRIETMNRATVSSEWPWEFDPLVLIQAGRGFPAGYRSQCVENVFEPSLPSSSPSADISVSVGRPFIKPSWNKTPSGNSWVQGDDVLASKLLIVSWEKPERRSFEIYVTSFVLASLHSLFNLRSFRSFQSFLLRTFFNFFFSVSLILLRYLFGYCVSVLL